MAGTTFLLQYCLILLLAMVHHHSFMADAKIITTNITTDQASLLALKDHIKDDPHNILTTNWSSATTTTGASSICNWVGVTCDEQHHRVTVLNLSYMGLTGTIPPQLGNLSFLTELSFTNNSFHSVLPKELARLRRLKFVDFGYNHLKGQVPWWFGWFPKLEVLNLYGNHFSGSLPTSMCDNLSSLQTLDLSENQLSGEPYIYYFI